MGAVAFVVTGTNLYLTVRHAKAITGFATAFGRRDFDRMYDLGDDAFRQRYPREDLVRAAEELEAIVGPFREVPSQWPESVQPVQAAQGRDQRLVGGRVRLRYERGEVIVQVTMPMQFRRFRVAGFTCFPPATTEPTSRPVQGSPGITDTAPPSATPPSR